MNFCRKATKVFAVSFLFFANSISINAQTDTSVNELQAGTKIRVQMDNEINSKVSSVNDTFTATISEPVRIRETVVLPIGIIIEGRITKVKRASIGRKNGNLALSFDVLRFANGEKRQINGVLINQLAPESSQTANVLTVIGGTALGTIFGTVSKAENGALIGAAVGTVAGAGVAYLRKGKDVRIKAAQEFEIELTKSVSLPVQDY